MIDATRCSGHGRCYDVAPALFTDDDRGYGQSQPIGPLCMSWREQQEEPAPAEGPQRFAGGPGALPDVQDMQR